ncbi:hypothetical protein LMB49_03745 [Limosilactobacillus reuteri]|uniref:hypothetical protein n=1 Tax=Limosilactobacillus reuteri TaxID=1598 RepID=UPI001E3054EA|nr:hypothetical protein [Limosilactobacillus reuteri]MCC4370510.1 hypothetical protein [Limosilactobacillus reuteri]MCC4509435.1 hypothetical protein [Limosilactobacillus reuteri]
MAKYIVFVLISLLVAVPLVSISNTSLSTSNQPYLFNTAGDIVWIAMIVITFLLGVTSVYLARKQDAFSKILVISLGIPMMLGIIALLAVSSLVRNNNHYTAKSIKYVLSMINTSYIITGITAVVIVIVVVAINYRNGWLKKNNWIAFISAGPGLSLGAVLYRHWSAWNEFITSKSFSNAQFAEMMNAFNTSGVPMNIGRANEPAYILTYFVPLMAYLILLIGGVVLVQKAEKTSKKREKR